MIFRMSLPEVKRKRSQNFGNAEISYLIELVDQYKDTIENKKNDAITWRDKDRAWREIAETLSSVFGERDTKSVKTKYEAIKKNLRKKWSVHKQDLVSTGGLGSEIKLESWEEKLKDVILLSAEEEDIIYDCDTIIEETGESIKIDEPLTYLKDPDKSGESGAESNCSGDGWVSNVQPRKKYKSDPGMKQLHSYQELAKKRIELVELQKSLMLKEYEDKKKREHEEHALKMKILEAELFIKETQIMKLNQ